MNCVLRTSALRASQVLRPVQIRSPATHTYSKSFSTTTTAKMSAPGENFEPRQTSTTDDYTPNPSKSINLPPARQRLVDDILALYSCDPTIERVKRYTPDCVYDDQFVYANDRFKMAGQWFALPKLFSKSINNGYEVIRSDEEMIQFKNDQTWEFRIPPLPAKMKTARVTGLVSLVLDPETKDEEFMQIKYHKDQANDKVSLMLLLGDVVMRDVLTGSRITRMRDLDSTSRSGRRIRWLSTWTRPR